MLCGVFLWKNILKFVWDCKKAQHAHIQHRISWVSYTLFILNEFYCQKIRWLRDLPFEICWARLDLTTKHLHCSIENLLLTSAMNVPYNLEFLRIQRASPFMTSQSIAFFFSIVCLSACLITTTNYASASIYLL